MQISDWESEELLISVFTFCCCCCCFVGRPIAVGVDGFGSICVWHPLLRNLDQFAISIGKMEIGEREGGFGMANGIMILYERGLAI